MRITETDIDAVEYAIDTLNDQVECGSDDPRTEEKCEDLKNLLDRLKRSGKT